MNFKKGDKVTVRINGAGVVSYEEDTVSRVSKGIVYLSGDGTSQGFRQDGKAVGAGMFGFSFSISKAV
jgi:hypothetical protein